MRTLGSHVRNNRLTRAHVSRMPFWLRRRKARNHAFWANVRKASKARPLPGKAW